MRLKRKFFSIIIKSLLSLITHKFLTSIVDSLSKRIGLIYVYNIPTYYRKEKWWLLVRNHSHLRTESNSVVSSTSARKQASCIIISITISLWTLILENLRVVCWWACLRFIIGRGATILWLIERHTCTLATYCTSVRSFHSQL